MVPNYTNFLLLFLRLLRPPLLLQQKHITVTIDRWISGVVVVPRESYNVPGRQNRTIRSYAGDTFIATSYILYGWVRIASRSIVN